MLTRRMFTCVLALLGTAGCGRSDEPRPAAASAGGTAPAGSARHAGALTYLALGDSYAIGESVEAAERWPVQLAAALRAERRDLSDPDIIARTGWRTDNLHAAITRANCRGPYDLVTLLIGVNN